MFINSPNQRGGIIALTLDARTPTDPSGGKLLVIDPVNDAFIVDLNGNLLARFDYRAALDIPFGVYAVTTISSGQMPTPSPRSIWTTAKLCSLTCPDGCRNTRQAVTSEQNKPRSRQTPDD